MKQINAADTDRTQGVPMIRIAQMDKPCFLALPGILPVLIGHLDGDLNRCRPIVRIKYFFQALGCDIHQTFGQFHRRGIR